MIVFVVSGLWHGANWSFMVWGALHGTYQIMEIQMNRLTKFLTLSQQAFFARSLVMRSIRAFYVFALVDFAWIFFRAGDLPSAVNFVARMFGEFQSGLNVATITTVGRVFGNRTDFFVAILAICLMEGVHVLQTKGSVGLLVARQPTAIRWAIYCFIVLSITILGVLGHQQFIYFQF
jgi:D-alanyl-lipoteichoic acid acyltransferase DltB (MBOAT superfamily)